MSPSLTYRTRREGIGGRIKAAPEDFIVEEILPDGTILERNRTVQRDDSPGNFTHFILQKRGWTTEGAIRRIAKALHVTPKRFSYAGSKDKTSISTQIVSAFRVKKKRIMDLSLKDIAILGSWRHSVKVRMGELLGNRFEVTVRETASDADDSIRRIHDELDGAFPNYFGEQRFGSIRRNTHIVGEQILKERYGLAARSFLCDYSGETRGDSINARRSLAEAWDLKKALEEFPKRLSLERTMLEHLEKYPNDYVNAFRKLPRGTLLLFVHAFQSHLFNISLSERIAEGDLTAEEGEYYCEEKLGFPDLKRRSSQRSMWIAGKIIGSSVPLSDREKRLLEQFDLRQADFEIKGIPELSSKGTYRLLLSKLKDFSFKDSVFHFCLPAGSYATVALREYLDRNKG